MSSYKKTDLTEIPLIPRLPPELPYAIDDFSLAMHLGVKCRTLWYVITNKRRMYRYFTLPKSSGGVRQIFNPHKNLKYLQKQLDQRLLKLMPTQDCVGAYVLGKSCRDSAQRHAGHKVRIAMDLRDFFPSHSRAMVRHFFQWVGYPHVVSGLLADLCTAQQWVTPVHPVPGAKAGYWRHFVPQGSPASPTLCNLIAQESLDNPVLRMIEGSGWVYTRYSDDLTLSHPEDKPHTDVNTLVTRMTELIQAAGYRTNRRKLKIQRHHHQQCMLGMVINTHPNIPREVYRRYRAIIKNCYEQGFEINALRYGFEPPQAFADHLRGKVSYFNSVNPERAATLMTILNQASQRHTTEFDNPDKWLGADLAEGSNGEAF